MATPNSRQTLQDYCLRRLGSPVIQINVDQTQIEDRLDDAIQFWQEYNTDSMTRVYRKYQVTQTDIDNQYITLPDALHVVTQVFPLVNTGINSSLWGVKFQMYLNDIYDLRVAGTMVNYELTKMYMDTLDMLLNGSPSISFNRYTNQLKMNLRWGQDILVNDWIVLEGFESIDPNTWTSVYNDMYLKRYATALLKRQWATNLSKFAGVQLVGGVTLNGPQMYQDAQEEITQIEAEVHSRFEMPPEMMTG